MSIIEREFESDMVIDVHAHIGQRIYSVPYTLVRELVEVRATPTTVEIFRQGQRVVYISAVVDGVRYAPF